MARGRIAPLLAAVVVVLTGSAASAQLISQTDERVAAADGTAFVVTSAVVRVKEMRADTGSTATVDLAVVRARRIGSTSSAAHVMLAGGPGDSGVAQVRGMVRQGGAMLADLMDGDLIGIDQRGTGASVPLLASPVRYHLPQDRAGSPQAWLPLMESAVRSVRSEVAARGIRLDAYNTSESADDVDEVRRALGYARVTVWGRSYGSHLALATMRRHQSSIERLILIGPEGPNHTWKLPQQADLVIDRIAERARMPELPSLMRRVIERLAAAPAHVPVTQPTTGQRETVVIGAFDLQWVTAQALGDPRTIRTLPAAYRRMANGDFTGIAPIVAARRAQAGIESAMKHAMDTSSGATPARRSQIAQQAAASLLGNAINFPGMDLERTWGVADLGDAFREPVTGDVPVLVLVGDLDLRTPVENGREILATLANGRLVTVENAAHQFDVFGSAAIRNVLRRFLAGDLRTDERVALPPLKVEAQ